MWENQATKAPKTMPGWHNHLYSFWWHYWQSDWIWLCIVLDRISACVTKTWSSETATFLVSAAFQISMGHHKARTHIMIEPHGCHCWSPCLVSEHCGFVSSIVPMWSAQWSPEILPNHDQSWSQPELGFICWMKLREAILFGKKRWRLNQSSIWWNLRNTKELHWNAGVKLK